MKSIALVSILFFGPAIAMAQTPQEQQQLDLLTGGINRGVAALSSEIVRLSGVAQSASKQLSDGMDRERQLSKELSDAAAKAVADKKTIDDLTKQLADAQKK